MLPSLFDLPLPETRVLEREPEPKEESESSPEKDPENDPDEELADRVPEMDS